MTYEQILADIRNKKYAPVYLLMGDEPYFIDQITDAVCSSVIEPEMRDFNQTIFYGLESNVLDVISACRRFPMMSDKQLVVVREAQKLSKIEELEHYLQAPLDSTVLVIAYKQGVIDKRKKIVAQCSKLGVLFESKKIQDYKIPVFVTSLVKTKGLSIDPKSSQMLADYLGNDLSKLSNELDKLIVALSATANKRITPDVIEENIGISKDFNVFELQRAIISKDVLKANQIADYFDKNPKNNPLVLTLGILFSFFSNLVVCYWAKDKSENGIVQELGLRNSYGAKDYVQALKNYNAFKCLEIISLIRIYDAKLKGVDNISTKEGDLLKELLFKILH